MSGSGAAPGPAAPFTTGAQSGPAPASRRFVVLAIVGVLLVVAAIAGVAWLLIDDDSSAVSVSDELATACRESGQLGAAADDGDLLEMERIVGQWEQPESAPPADSGAVKLDNDVLKVVLAWAYIDAVSGDPSVMVIPALRLELECTRLGLVDDVAPSQAGDDTSFEDPETTTAPTIAPATTTTVALPPEAPGPSDEPCEGASGCAFENGIDLNAVRSELAAELTSGGFPTAADDVDCEQGDVPPNSVPVGGSFPCVVTPDVNGALSAFEVTVTGVGTYRWESVDV